MKDAARKIIKIITANFTNGLRDDFIDTNKVLRLYTATYTDRNISREFIVDVIHKSGIYVGSRFYFISESICESVRQLVDKIFASNTIAYYSVVYEKHADFFAKFHIFSPKVLKKILSKTDADFFYFDEFCTKIKTVRLDYEISKIFSENEKALSVSDLQKKLPYVPVEKISEVLGNTKKFLPTLDCKYIAVPKIRFDFEEIQSAEQQISFHINSAGYATYDVFSFDSNVALNPELNEKALYNLIYQNFLSDTFTKRGRKLFRKNTVVGEKLSQNVIENLREFVSAKDELTVEELFAYGRKFKSEDYDVPLSVAHTKMIRVEKNLFVKDSLVKFDVDGIDEALKSFVQGKIIPLSSVTSFTDFPKVEGYLWNLFLLESFLRKFSRKYVYVTSAANSSNVGAIYPKSLNFKEYLDVQAAVVIQENIPLERNIVEDFLIEQGFRIKRMTSTTQKIIDKAQELLSRNFLKF